MLIIQGSGDWQLQTVGGGSLQGLCSVFTADSAHPALPLSPTPAAWGLFSASLSHSLSPVCDKESLSLEPCHRSRKWFLPQVGGAGREWQRESQVGGREWKWWSEREDYRPESSVRSILELRPVQVESTSSSSFTSAPPLSSLPVTLEHRGSARCVVFVSQAPEEPQSAGSQPGPRLGEGVLHVCLQRVGQLELWLQEARGSLLAAGAAGSSTMQDSVEQQLLTCQVSPAHQGTRSLPEFSARKTSRQRDKTGSNEAEQWIFLHV